MKMKSEISFENVAGQLNYLTKLLDVTENLSANFTKAQKTNSQDLDFSRAIGIVEAKKEVNDMT
jgi:hypothetical protein